MKLASNRFNLKNKKDNHLLFFLFLLIIIIKSIIALAILNFVYSSGPDAVYYDEFARNLINHMALPVNGWPFFLRFLNEIGIYNYDYMVFIIFFTGNIIIPIQVASLSQTKRDRNKSIYWLTAIATSLYASIFYFSLDLLRDIPALFIFLAGLFIIKSTCNKEGTGNIMPHLKYAAIFFIGAILFSLRKYLGFAYFLSFIFCHMYPINRKSLIIMVIAGLIITNIAFKFGILNSIIEYRSQFDQQYNGSTFGINIYKNDNLFIFNLKLALSFCYNMLGIYIFSTESIFFLVFESLPFCIFFCIILKYSKFNSDKFTGFLVIFFIIYSSIWVLGNDNLGTAIRLRIFSYIPILIASFLLHKTDKDFCKSR